MNKDEIKELSERAIQMLEEQKAELEWWERSRELNGSITASPEAFEKMLDVLENPPEPSDKIREAFAKHKQHVLKEDRDDN